LLRLAVALGAIFLYGDEQGRYCPVSWGGGRYDGVKHRKRKCTKCAVQVSRASQAAGLIRLTSQALSALAGLAKYTPGGYSSLWRDGRHITTSALIKVDKLVKLVCLLC
ncbi:hypothetical protein V8C86DRAFT_2486601, partial [Haematococcus lacustris]